MEGDLLRVGFVPGVTPDRWRRAWSQRGPGPRLELVPLPEDADPVAPLWSGDLGLCLLRLPIDREGLHLVRLYDEQPVVVVSVEHPVAVFDEVSTGDLEDETLLAATGPTGTADAVAAVAADAGVLVVPLSLARLHHRRDVVAVPIHDADRYPVALAWRRDRDSETHQAFVGVVRGRTARSSR